MTKIVTIDDVKAIINKVGILKFFRELVLQLESDFKRWDEFKKSPRHAIHYPQGVMELMPTSDDQEYAFKFVNGHPGNPKNNKLSIVALGLFAEVHDGFPLMVSEMTLLTAFRTAATSALVSSYLAKQSSKSMGIIGTGSQGEFQVLAHHAQLGINQIKYFDIDPAAMDKFANNLSDADLELIPCASAEETLKDVDIITSATANKERLKIIDNSWVTDGMHINGIGGDCPGKTELEAPLLERAKIVIEFFEQSIIEGEIQDLDENAVYAEIWEIAQGKKPGRENDSEVTLFDSVGFAIEDFSALTFLREQALSHGIYEELDLVAALQNPRNLFGLLRPANHPNGRAQQATTAA